MSSRAASLRARAIALRGALFCAIWWSLTGGHSDAWGVMGAVTIVAALVLSLMLTPPRASRFSLAGLAGFAGFFILQSIKGGVQVALMALRPRLDLRPGLLEIPLRLQERTGQIFLTNVLSLLPGTLGIGLEDNCLHLHVLNRRLPVTRDVRRAEKWVARMLGMDLR